MFGNFFKLFVGKLTCSGSLRWINLLCRSVVWKILTRSRGLQAVSLGINSRSFSTKLSWKWGNSVMKSLRMERQEYSDIDTHRLRFDAFITQHLWVRASSQYWTTWIAVVLTLLVIWCCLVKAVCILHNATLMSRVGNWKWMPILESDTCFEIKILIPLFNSFVCILIYFNIHLKLFKHIFLHLNGQIHTKNVKISSKSWLCLK